MANVNRAYGLVPVRSIGGWNGEVVSCVALATYGVSLFVGDPIILAGSGDISGRPSIAIAVGGGTTTNALYGVITGFDPRSPDTLAVNYGPASTTRIVQVVPCFPNVLFRVNASGATGPNPDDLGLHFDLVSGAGSTLTGKSGWALDVGEDAVAGATSGRNCRLYSFVNRPDNEIGVIATDTAGIDCLVTFAESTWITADGGV